MVWRVDPPRLFLVASDQVQFGALYPGVLLGPIACDPPPDSTGYQGPSTALNQNADRQPWCRMNQVSKWRRQAASRSDAGEDQAVDEASFVRRKPSHHKLIGRGIDDRLAHAEPKAQRNEDHCRIRNETKAAAPSAPLRRPTTARRRQAPGADHIGLRSTRQAPGRLRRQAGTHWPSSQAAGSPVRILC